MRGENPIVRAIWLILIFSLAAVKAVRGDGVAKHVVVVVWDGMRPDFVSASNTPALYGLANRGVFFKNNHSVYLSSTEVNGTALATGDYPEHSGVIANQEYRPDIDPLAPIATESLQAMRKADEHGHYLNVPTLAEILHSHGLTTVIAGCKPVVLLHDRAERPDNSPDPILFEGRTMPPRMKDRIIDALGPFPGFTSNKMGRDLWTTHALIGPLWTGAVPAFSLLWLAEPDNTQHATGVGSPAALQVIHNSDDALSQVIRALKEKGVYDSTDIFVVSDHGFSTITRFVDVASRLRDAGFNAFREYKASPAKGDILVVGLGGSALLYIADHDKPTISRLVQFLQSQDFAGVIFTKSARKGTFALDAGMIDSAQAPDIAFSFRWTNATNPYGAPGELIADGQGTSNPSSMPGLKGTHVSLSHFDLNNTLVAAGPGIRRGLVSLTPSGNVDVAPTILHLLGVKPAEPMDGRVLAEALDSFNGKLPKIKQRELKASVELPGGVWTQHLSINQVKGVRYLDEGNGAFFAGKARH